MNYQYLKKLKLPDSPGVYIFRDSKKRPFYIGRATSLKDRVKSYFANDLIMTRGPRIVDMITKAKSTDWQETSSVLEAVLLESALIKKYQPFYNVAERDDKSDQYVIITEEEWSRVFLVRARDFDIAVKEGTLAYEVKKVFGPFPDGGLIKEALKILRKLFPFRDKKANDPRHDLFYQSIGRSPTGTVSLNSSAAQEGVFIFSPKPKDACQLSSSPNFRFGEKMNTPSFVADEVGETVPDPNKQYQKTINELILFFEGKKKQLRLKLQREMKEYSDKMEFEEAGRVKKLLFALDHIRDIALLKRENNQSLGSLSNTYRLEAYDIAHLSGTNVVGAMVVSIGGKSTPSEYRKYKISKQTNNDISGLVEILSRRLNHSEWTYPDLIIVDGNEVHAKVALAVLGARRINIPVVAVTKDDRHKVARIIGHPEIIKSNKVNIIALNAEAHRFTVSYHRSLRKI